MIGLVRLAGVLLALVVATGVVGALLGGRLAPIQLGRDTAVVDELVGDAARRRALRRGLWIDFGFLTAYWLAFVTVAVLLAHRGHWGRWVGAAALLAATATTLLDATENMRTFGVLARHRSADVLPVMQLRELRRTSLAKWAVSATTVALLATLFLQHGWIHWLAVALLALAAIGVAGLVWNPLVQLYMLGVGAASAVIAVVFLGWPDVVLRGL